MALVLADRVKETCTAPGTGTVTLLGASTGYQAFSVVGNGNTTYYCIADQGGANWEVGIGTYTSSGTTLSRDTILASSNGGATVNFASGTQDVFVTYPSERSLYVNGSAITPGSAATLGTGSGGTGLTTFTAANNAIYSTSSSALTAGTLPVLAGGTGQTAYTDGQLLVGNTSTGGLTKATLTQGTGITVTNGNGSITIAATATGDVVGPASATDNAVARFDGTSGKLIQNSAVTIADSTGDITGGKYNKVAITAPATGSTLTIADGKTLTANNTLTLSGTDSTTMTFPATSQTIAGLAVSSQVFTTAQTFRAASAIRSEAAATQDAVVLAGRAGGTSSYEVTITPTTLSADRTLTLADGDTTLVAGTVAVLGTAQTFTATNTFSQINYTNNAITASAGGAATVPITYRLNTVTNNATPAATITITMTTTSAVDGQMCVVRIYDSTAAAVSVSWVNTQNSTVTAPTTTNGSTTLPLTVGFMYNAASSLWRCVASA